MATTQKKPPRRRSSTSKRSKKKSSAGFDLKNMAISLIFIGLLSTTAYLYFRGNRGYVPQADDWVESVLLAANVDPERQVERLVKDGTERWKISLQNKATKTAILRALERGAKARNDGWNPGKEIWRDGVTYHIVDLERADTIPLRLIFVIEQKATTPQKPVAKPPAKPDTKVAKASPAKREPVKPAAVKASPAPTDGQDAPVMLIERDDEAPLVAVILDDIGHKKASSLKSVLDLKFPITFAVIPHLPESKSCAYYLHQNQYEVMLHMPMEPGNPKVDPGEGAIFAHFNETQIREALIRGLNAVPFVTGVNNHMGSKITASRTLMRPVLDDLKQRGLYYIDSRTQSNTVAFKMARDMGLRAGRRDVFLDSEMSFEFAKKQLRETRRVAKQQGFAVLIGHPYPSSLKALAEEMPKMDREGFRFVFASRLVRDYSDQL